MGTRGREIVGIDVEHLLKLLNQAYASEWLGLREDLDLMVKRGNK